MSGINQKSPDPTGILDGMAPTQEDLYAEPDEAEQEEVHRVEKLFQTAFEAASQRLIEDNVALATTFGDQYLAISPDTGTIYRVVDSAQAQYVSQNNQLIKAHLALWGKLIKANPDFSVTPGGGGQADMYGARAAEKFLEFYSTTRKVGETISAAKSDATWSKLGGCVELDWDPLGGSTFHHCFTCGYSTDEELSGDDIPCPHCEMQHQQYAQAVEQYQMQSMAPGGTQGPMQGPGAPPPVQPGLPPGGMAAPGPQAPPPQPPPPQGVLEELNRGGPRIRDIDSRNVFLQPGVERSSSLQWYATREPLPCQIVRAAFPDKALLIHPEPRVFPNHGAQWTITDDTYVTSEVLNDHVYLYRIVEGPSTLYPDGRITYMANRRILAQRPGCFRDFGRLPLFRFGWIPIRGTPYYRTPAADAIHRQRELNRTETQLSEHSSVIAKPKVVLPFGSRVATDELTSQSIQVLQPTMATANQVRYLLPPPMSQDVYTRRETLTAEIHGVYAVTVQEVAGSSDASGRYAAIAEAESDQTVGPIIRAHNQEHADLMRCLLVLVQRYGDPEEKFFALGDDNQELYMFQDLMFRAKRSNVALVPTDGMSSNAAIRKQEANTQLQLGLYGDPTMGIDKAAYAEAAGLKLRGLQPTTTDTEIQAAYAAIARLKDGLPYQPKQYDDAEVFANTLLRWLRANGRRYEEQNPTLIQQVTDLMMYYQNILFQVAAANAAPQGAPGAPPANSSSDASSPGGSPNSAVPADGPEGDAAAIQKNADQRGEQAAQGLVPHEG